MTVVVRPMTEGDLVAVAAVGAAAGERFRSVADPRVARCADDPPLTDDELRSFLGPALVAVDDDGAVVGFVLLEVVDGVTHIEEISVHPGAQGAGVGSALLDAVAGPVTLTTFRDVPWNRPFYERRGFVVLVGDSYGPGMAAKVAEEAEHGLDPSIRVVMRRG